MSNPKRIKKIHVSSKDGFTLALAAGMFLLGVAAHKYRDLPYPRVRSVVRSGIQQLTPWSVRPDTVLLKQYSRDLDALPVVRDIDTALLPLRIRGARISDSLPVPKVAGAITTIGNTVIVLDRVGNIYSSTPDGQSITRLPFPPLPNNLTEYLKEEDAGLDDNTFRTYDIEYIRPAKMFAVSHEYFDAQVGSTKLAVSVIGIDEQALRPTGPWETIFVTDIEPGRSNVEAGGRLASKGDRLYLTVGDYADESFSVAQNSQSSFGKIIEINIGTKKHKIVSIGHRNAQGLLVTQAGELLSTEHGPAGGDELNLITQGANYGWPNVTLGTGYGTYSWRKSTLVGEHTGYQPPMFAWVPSIAVSNLIQVERFNKRWDGDLLIGSLKAESLFRLRLEGTRILYAEPIWIGQRIRDISQLENGTIVLWTDDTQLLFISVDESKLAKDVRPAKLTDEALNGACMYCHHFGPTNASDFAPTLSNLFTRKIASDNFRYSTGLRNKEGVWTEEALRQFLHNPASFANGTGMPTPNLQEEQLSEVINALKRAGDAPDADAPAARDTALKQPEHHFVSADHSANHRNH